MDTSNFKFYLKLLFFLLTCGNYSVFGWYRSCYEAIWANRKNGNYEIQIRNGGEIGNISCILLKYKLSSMIDHNLKPDTFLHGQVKFTFPVRYSNFNTEDIRTFTKQLDYNCHQSINYTENSAYISHQKFTFWDDVEIPLENSIDGICKCLISEECDKSGLTNSPCKTISGHLDKNQHTDIGKFAVKPERLPVKTLVFGDVDNAGEYIYYTLNNLICEEDLYPKVKVLGNSNFCPQDWKALFDSNSKSCIIIRSNPIILKINFPMEINEIRINSTTNICEDLNVFGRAGVHARYSKICKLSKIDNCLFQCHANVSEIMIFSFKRNSLNLCELSYEYI